MFCFLLTFTLFSLLYAREQQVFSGNSPKPQKISPHQHHQPLSLLLSQHPLTFDCVLLSPPEPAQFHRLIQNQGDVVIVNKSALTGTDSGTAHTFEILGFNEQDVWTKVSELCNLINYKYFNEEGTLSEYEVVSLKFKFGLNAEKATLFW